MSDPHSCPVRALGIGPVLPPGPDRWVKGLPWGEMQQPSSETGGGALPLTVAMYGQHSVGGTSWASQPSLNSCQALGSNCGRQFSSFSRSPSEITGSFVQGQGLVFPRPQHGPPGDSMCPLPGSSCSPRPPQVPAAWGGWVLRASAGPRAGRVCLASSPLQ